MVSRRPQLIVQVPPPPTDVVMVVVQTFIQPTEISPLERHGAIMPQPAHSG
jgi:hypothetical protein